MEIKTAIILCAGFGKRLNPLTLDTPKPLLKLNNVTLLENTINLIIKLGIKKILLNTYYLKKQIKDYLKKKNFKITIDIIDDGNKILDTGGGIKNMIQFSKEENFLIFNPDTIWNINYYKCINKMEIFFKRKKIKNILLVVNKKLSFDHKLKGDFNLKNGKLFKDKKNQFIYTGCQIICRDLLDSKYKVFFSITELWNKLIKKNSLYGFESRNKFYHISNLDTYKKLLKNN